MTTFTHLASGSYKGLVARVTEGNVPVWQSNGLFNTALHRSFTFDTLGNLRTDSLPHGVRTLYERDVRGDVSAIWSYDSLQRSFVRDALGRILEDRQATRPASIPGGMNLLAGCDAQATICTDSARVDLTLPVTLTTTYVHSPSGITSVTDPRGVDRSYRYGPRGEVRAETDDYGKRTVATTNAAGQLSSVLTRLGKTITYSYDVYGRRSGLAYPTVVYDGFGTVASGAIAYTYDLLGRMTQATGEYADVKRWYYADGSLRATLSPNAATYDSVSYTYDATGARTMMAVQISPTTADTTWYRYNAITGDLDSLIVQWDGVSGSLATSRGFKFEWDGLGRRSVVHYPLSGGNMRVRYYRDKLGLVRWMTVDNAPEPLGGGGALLGVSETVDSVDPSGRALRRNLACEADDTQPGNPCGTSGVHWLSSRFNQLGWLVAQHSSVTIEADSLRYDASGNITWRKQGLYQPKTFTTESGHNRLIQIVQSGSPTFSIVYDAAGSRLTEVDSGSYFIDRQYFYDALGRTNGIFNIFDDENGSNQSAGGIGMCRHDALGRQIQACPALSPPLAFDGDNIIRALNWRFRHGPGLDDPLIALSAVGVAGPRELYYVTDGEGRHYAVGEGSGGLHSAILAGSDGYAGFRASGAVTNSHSYGEARLSQPNAPGLSFFRNRVYDQETGRWTQEDPIGISGGINLYQFNGNDPATYGDPYGLGPCEDRGITDVFVCVGLLLKPAQLPLEIAGTLATAPLMISGEGALMTLGLGGKASQATSTFFRGVSAAEASDIVASGNRLRAGAAAAGNAGKYVTNTAEAASQWGAQNGAGAQVIKITMPADATRTLTPLNGGAKVDGIGRAWWGRIEAFKDATIEFVKDAVTNAP